MPTTLMIEDLLDRIRGEYREMPGLRLSRDQAQRLWGMDPLTCEALLDALVTSHFLYRTHDGAFAMVQADSPAMPAGRQFAQARSAF